jgi:hypothetical protein
MKFTLCFSDLSEQQKAQLWDALQITGMPIPAECTVMVNGNGGAPSQVSKEPTILERTQREPTILERPTILEPVTKRTILQEYPAVPPEWMTEFMTGGYDDDEGVFIDSVEAGLQEICGPRARWLDASLIAELWAKHPEADVLRLHVATPVVCKTWGDKTYVEYRAPVSKEMLCTLDIPRGTVPRGIGRGTWKVVWV